MWILKAGVLYFAIVFGAGFVIGPIRILGSSLVPGIGNRVFTSISRKACQTLNFGRSLTG
ncbi:MAG: hypothetical protein A2169_09855 [Deltaproteobacteria bacterium RBG_13_47_9]|nr:MAG: hypothetical protein A2169_09855 [Deltaproteobacteria bacterium RBG_13_47_9]